MTHDTLSTLHAAIADHLNSSEPGAVLTDWFIGYSAMSHDPDDGGGILHGIHYTASDSSPQAVVGIARLALDSLKQDLAE